jgi:hypothetical protein
MIIECEGWSFDSHRLSMHHARKGVSSWVVVLTPILLNFKMEPEPYVIRAKGCRVLMRSESSCLTPCSTHFDSRVHTSYLYVLGQCSGLAVMAKLLVATPLLHNKLHHNCLMEMLFDLDRPRFH